MGESGQTIPDYREDSKSLKTSEEKEQFTSHPSSIISS